MRIKQSRLAVDSVPRVPSRGGQKTPCRIHPTCAHRPQLLCGSDDKYRSIDWYAGRICSDLGHVAHVATRRHGPKSVADDCGGFGDFRQCCDLDCAGRARAVFGSNRKRIARTKTRRHKGGSSAKSIKHHRLVSNHWVAKAEMRFAQPIFVSSCELNFHLIGQAGSNRISR